MSTDLGWLMRHTAESLAHKASQSLKAKQGVAPEPPVAKMITTTTTMAATTLRAGQGVTASSPRRL